MRLRSLSTVVGFIALAGLASATPLCSNGGVGFTLVNQTVTNNTVIDDSSNNTFGAGMNACTVGGLTFDNFQIAVKTGYQTPANLTVTVTATATGFGLDFGANISQSAGQDIEVEFRVTPGATVIILGDGPGGGFNEVVCSKQMLVTAGNCGAVGGVLLGSGSVSGSNNSTIIVTPNAVDWIFKDVAGVSEFSQTFVPEPTTLSLLGAGLLGLGLLRRRFRK